MNPEKIEKLFLLMIVVWLVLRTLLMAGQYMGNSDPQYRSGVLKHFSEADIRAGKEYALQGFWFKAFYGIFFMGALLALAYSRLHFRLYDYLGSTIGEGFFKSDLALVVVFFLFLKLLGFPASLYFGYIRETQAGFSNLDFWGWLIHYFKAVATAIPLETAAVMILLAVLRLFPFRWPIVLPLALGAFMAGVILLYPIIITPIFYNKTPLANGPFRDRLLGLAKTSGMQVEEVYVVDESRYSKHTNAYFSGFGRFRKIVLYDNLVNNHTADEAALIFAHEAGHWKYNHIAWGISLGVLGIALISAAAYFLFPLLAGVKSLGLKVIDSPTNLPAIFVIYTAMQLIFAPVESQISQFMERQADQTALELTQNTEAYVSAQVKLSRENKSDLLPSPFRVFWLYSHPPALERIKMAETFKSQP